MAFLDLVESFSSKDFVVPISLCIVLGSSLIFFLIKWLSAKQRHATVDVDEIQWNKDIKSGSQKTTKQKKGKTSANAVSDSSRPKPIQKPSPATKVVSAPAPASTKEKSTEGKQKASAKKQPTVSSAVTNKPVKLPAEEQEDWTVAGSKKKNKNKKTEATVEDSKKKSPQTTKQPKETEKLQQNVAPNDVVKTDVTHVGPIITEANVVSAGETENFIQDSAQSDVIVNQPLQSAYSEKADMNSNKEQTDVDTSALVKPGDSSVEIGKAQTETKTKKSSKKKKPKAGTVATGSEIADEKNLLPSPRPRDDNVQNIESIPSNDTVKSVVSGGKLSSRSTVPDDVASMKNTGAMLKPLKEEPKDKVTERIEKEYATSMPEVPKANIPAAAGVSADFILSNSKPMETVTSGIPSSQVAFDELGLKDESMDVGQTVMKKKKKARRDM